MVIRKNTNLAKVFNKFFETEVLDYWEGNIIPLAEKLLAGEFHPIWMAMYMQLSPFSKAGHIYDMDIKDVHHLYEKFSREQIIKDLLYGTYHTRLKILNDLSETCGLEKDNVLRADKILSETEKYIRIKVTQKHGLMRVLYNLRYKTRPDEQKKSSKFVVWSKSEMPDVLKEIKSRYFTKEPYKIYRLKKC